MKLSAMTVGDIRRLLVDQPAVITEDQPIENLLQKIVDDPRTRHVYVVDETGVLIGSVRMNAVVRFLFPLEATVEQGDELLLRNFASFEAKTVRDIMNDEPYYVTESTSLGEMASLLIREQINELPVVDDGKRIIGQVNVYEVIMAYLKEIRKT